MAGQTRIMRVRRTQTWPVTQIYSCIKRQLTELIRLAEEARKRTNWATSYQHAEMLVLELQGQTLVTGVALRVGPVNSCPRQVRLQFAGDLQVDATVARSILSTYYTLFTQPHLKNKEGGCAQ
jgi:hypothetical protein